MRLKCPHCGVEGTADDKMAGRTVRCGKCENRFVARFNEPVVETEEVQSEALLQAEDSYSPEQLEETASQKIASTELSDNSSPPAIETNAAVAEEMRTVSCPECKASGRVNAALVGKAIKCPKCGYNFVASAENSESLESPVISEIQQTEPVAPSDPFSILAPSPQFSVIEICKEAFRQSFNIRFSLLLWAAAICVSICTNIIYSLFEVIFTAVAGGAMTEGEFSVLSIVLFVIIGALYLGISTVFDSGLFYFGARHVAGLKVRLKTAFRGLSKYCRGSLFKMGIIQWLLICIGYLLLIIPGIYLSLAYIFSGLLIIDRGLGWWDGLEVSRKAVHPVWWRVFGAYLLMSLPTLLAGFTIFLSIFGKGTFLPDSNAFLVIASLFFMVCLFYSVPAMVVLIGLLYKELFKPKKEQEDQRLSEGL